MNLSYSLFRFAFLKKQKLWLVYENVQALTH